MTGALPSRPDEGVNRLSQPGVWLLDVLRTWSWRHSGYALILGMFTLSNLGAALFFNAEFPWLRSLVYNVLQFGFPTVLWLRWVDRAVGLGGWSALVWYGLCPPVVACVGVLIFGWLLSLVIGGDPDWSLSNDLSLISLITVCLSLVTAGYAYFQASDRAQAALRAENEVREAQAQALSAAKLLVMQARMEPQLLFDALKRIRDQVGLDDAQADAMLCDLINLLRAMQPHGNAGASTLGRELSLLQNYAKVADVDALQRLHIDCSAAERNLKLAPLLLLPLLRTLGERVAGEQSLWLRAVSIMSDQNEKTLRIDVEVKPDLDLHAVDLHALLDRLRQVHGPQGSLVHVDGTIRIEVPAVPLRAIAISDDLSVQP